MPRMPRGFGGGYSDDEAKKALEHAKRKKAEKRAKENKKDRDDKDKAEAEAIRQRLRKAVRRAEAEDHAKKTRAEWDRKRKK